MIRTEMFHKFGILKVIFIIYLPLTLFEFALVGRTGSFLKWFGFCIMGLYIFYAVNGIRNTQPIRINKQILVLGFWVLWNCFTYLWTRNPAIGGYYIQAIGNMLILVYIVSKLNWTQKELDLVQNAYIFGAVIFSLLMITNGDLYHGTGIRYTLYIGGHEIDPNNISGLLLPACIFCLQRILDKYHALFFGFCMVVIVFACVLGASRGGLLGIIVGFSVYYIVYVFSKGERKKARNTSLSVFVLLLGYWIIVNNADPVLLDRLNLANLTADQGSGRTELWKTGLQLFLQKPIWGWGIGSYGLMTGSGMHNQYLIALMESGLIGFVLFMTALWLYIKRLYNHKSALGLALIFGAMVIIFFVDAYQKKYFWNCILFSEIILSTFKNRTLEIFIGSNK